MEFLLIIIGVGLFLYFINQNKTQSINKTTTTHIQTVKTEDGEAKIKREQTTESISTIYTTPSSSVVNIQPRETTPLKVVEQADRPQPVLQQTIQASRPVVHSTAPLIDQAPAPPSEPVTFEAKGINTSNGNIDLKKKCPRCGRSSPYVVFKSSQKYDDGLTKWCAECLEAPKDTPKQKYCPKCKKRRMKTNFYKNSNRWDGLTAWCKICMDKSKK